MTIAVTTSITALTPITGFAGTASDREGWAEQAAQNGTDWSGVLDAARAMVVLAIGEITLTTFEAACREADRKAASRLRDEKLERLRPLLDDEVTLPVAGAALNEDRPTPRQTGCARPRHGCAWRAFDPRPTATV
jgi:hypothetical protein